jgi:5S rRNA maturation endonuclease (ribonuclease M5)
MNINLNKEEYNFEKKFLNKENVLEDVNEYSIFRHYIGEFTVGSLQSSPFRKDNKPSFGVFFSKNYNCLLYKDLAKGTSGDCFTMIMNEVHPTFSYHEALAQVVIDFGIHHRYIMPRTGFVKKKGATILKPTDYKNTIIKPVGIKARRFALHDYNFWGTFGISRQMLKYYNVVPISHFTYGNNVFKADKHAYAYIEKKDGLTTYKIYQPFSESIKFFTDMNASIHAGYTQLPEKGELLLITKSLKDVMSIKEVCNIPAISVLSETILIKPSVIEEYKERFDWVIVFFDNDTAGERMAAEYKKEFGLDNIKVPHYCKNCKDFSDVVRNEAPHLAKSMVENALWLLENKEIDDLPF